jgi:hypothetical protein
MTERSSLMVGVKLKEVATPQVVYTNCNVLHADSMGLAFEVERTVAEGGNIETVTTQMLIPWHNILHIIVMEQRE